VAERKRLGNKIVQKGLIQEREFLIGNCAGSGKNEGVGGGSDPRGVL